MSWLKAIDGEHEGYLSEEDIIQTIFQSDFVVNAVNNIAQEEINEGDNKAQEDVLEEFEPSTEATESVLECENAYKKRKVNAFDELIELFNDKKEYVKVSFRKVQK